MKAVFLLDKNCETCDVLVCDDCMMTSHEGHDVGSAEDACLKFKAKIDQLISRFENVRLETEEFDRNYVRAKRNSETVQDIIHNKIMLQNNRKNKKESKCFN